MSEPDKSGNFFHSGWVSLLILVIGLFLLWFGNLEYQQFQSDIGDYVIARPDNHIIWLLIIGAAASLAGIIGLLRGRTI